MAVLETNSEHPRASAIRSVLRELNASSSEVEASAAITTDGFILGSVLGEGIDQDRFAAMCASLLALADRAADEISRGELKQVMIEGSSGVMLLVHAGEDAVLAVATKPTASLGRVFIEARKTAARINTTLGG
jgi:predicted regulator of Ras-like GTPase activity (Roadblock/LC7/MglB family)